MHFHLNLVKKLKNKVISQRTLTTYCLLVVSTDNFFNLKSDGFQPQLTRLSTLDWITNQMRRFLLDTIAIFQLFSYFWNWKWRNFISIQLNSYYFLLTSFYMKANQNQFETQSKFQPCSPFVCKSWAYVMSERWEHFQGTSFIDNLTWHTFLNAAKLKDNKNLTI